MSTPLTRRGFLTKSVLFAGSMFGYHEWVGAQEGGETERLAFFSDIHVSSDATRELRGVNMANNLQQVVKEILEVHQSRPLLGACLTGDIAAGAGFVEDYQKVKELVEPVMASTLPLHLLMGNHDHRENCNSVFGKYQPQGIDLKPQIATKISLKHVNLFLLDSLIKVNYTPGEIGAVQLEWLSRELLAEPNKPAVVLVHHNLKFDENKNALTDTEALFNLSKKHPSLKAYLYGHSHIWSVEEREGKHLVNLPPVAYTFTDGLPSGWVEVEFSADRAELTLHTTQKAHELEGSKYVLKWS